MELSAAVVLSALSFLVAGLGLVRTFLASGKQDATVVSTGLARLEERCALLEMKMGMFWRLVEEHLSGMLKKPTHEEMDMLLDKLRDHTLALEEARQLRWWLQRVYLEAEATHAQERITAILVSAAVESVIQELEREAKKS